MVLALLGSPLMTHRSVESRTRDRVDEAASIAERAAAELREGRIVEGSIGSFSLTIGRNCGMQRAGGGECPCRFARWTGGPAPATFPESSRLARPLGVLPRQ